MTWEAQNDHKSSCACPTSNYLSPLLHPRNHHSISVIIIIIIVIIIAIAICFTIFSPFPQSLPARREGENPFPPHAWPNRHSKGNMSSRAHHTWLQTFNRSQVGFPFPASLPHFLPSSLSLVHTTSSSSSSSSIPSLPRLPSHRRLAPFSPAENSFPYP